jgi:large subunit ribosomal protein LP0
MSTLTDKEKRIQKKNQFIDQFIGYLETYKKVIIVQADNVSSNQFATIRKQLRGLAVVQMGKNTLLKRAIKKYLDDKEKKYNNKANAQKVYPFGNHLKGNVGLIFTNGDLSKVKEIIENNKIGAPARQGAISPVEVVIPAVNTGLEPTKTAFFQALNITTKITRGTVEIVSPHLLLKVGDKVGNSEATLLQMLNIKPFAYGLKILTIFDDGTFYSPSVLDLTDEILAEKWRDALSSFTAFSLAVDHPNEASIPHMVANSFKDLLAVAVETGYSFKEAEETLEYLKDPSKFASAAPVQTSAPVATKAPAEEAPAKKEESESEEDEDAFGGLF